MPTFAHPAWLWLALLALPLILLRLWSGRRRKRVLSRWAGERLRKKLLSSQHPALSWTAFLLQIAGLVLLAITLARPQLGEIKVETETEGRSVLIALDTSRSMLCEDVEPSRIDRAKLAAEDLVRALPGERIGLIAFAGQPFLQAPLTVDHSAVVETISQLDTESIPRGGTNLALALDLASETFKKADSGLSALILLSDGDELEGAALQTALLMKDKGMIIISVGVGTEFGGPVPDPTGRSPDGFIHDRDGAAVRSRLERTGLQKIANASGGLYLDLPSGSLQAGAIAAALDRLESQTVAGDQRTIPIERYRWPLAAALLFLAAGHILGRIAHRGRTKKSKSPMTSLTQTAAPAKLVALLTCLLLPTLAPPSSAQTITIPIETTPDSEFGGLIGSVDEVVNDTAEAIDTAAMEEAARKPLQAYQSGNFQAAAQGFANLLTKPWRRNQTEELEFGQGSAAYRSGDYEAAIESFGKSLLSEDETLRSNSHYNLGNSLFRLGSAAQEKAPEATIEQWESALSHYDSTLELNPDHPDAQFNRDHVAKRLEELQQQEQQKEEEEQDEEEEEDSDKEKEENEGEENEEEKGDEEEQDKSDSEDGEEGDEGEQEQEGEDGDDPEEGEQGEEGEEGEQDGEEQENEGGEGENGEQEQDNSGGEQEDGGDGGDEQNDEPQDGELEAQGGQQAEPSEKGEQSGARPEERENAETGFSPTRARALLRSFADEDLTVRPDLPKPQRGERFKDW